MKFMEEYSWKQAVFSLVILIIGGILITIITHSGSIEKDTPIDWNSFFIITTPMLSFITFFPVILVEKIITPIQEKRKKNDKK